MTDKWGRRLFKSGAVFLIILGLVHSFSLFTKLAPANATEKQLIDLMDNYKFNPVGSPRTMSDLFRGFSTCFMLAAFGFGLFDIALWGERSGLVKRAALVNLIWLAAMIAVALKYFFIVPISFRVIALLLFLLAWWRLPSEASA